MASARLIGDIFLAVLQIGDIGSLDMALLSKSRSELEPKLKSVRRATCQFVLWLSETERELLSILGRHMDRSCSSVLRILIREQVSRIKEERKAKVRRLTKPERARLVREERKQRRESRVERLRRRIDEELRAKAREERKRVKAWRGW